MESFKDTINGILEGFATNNQGKQNKILQEIATANLKLRRTPEWQHWHKSLEPTALNRMQDTIEWRNYSLLLTAYQSMYGDNEFKQGEERVCEDCRQDNDMCPDCCDGDLYRSPDEYEVFGMER